MFGRLLFIACVLALPAQAQVNAWEYVPGELPCWPTSLTTPASGGIVLAGTECGVFRYDGAGWSRVGGLEESVWAVRDLPDGRVYALTFDAGNRILRRFDPQTTTWESLLTMPSLLADDVLEVTASGVLLVGLGVSATRHGQGLTASTDGGQTWTQVDEQRQYTLVRVAGDHVIAASVECPPAPCLADLQRSADGLAWEEVDGFWDVGETSGLVYDVAATPSGALVAGVFGTTYGIRRSFDGGQTWTAAATPAGQGADEVIAIGATVISDRGGQGGLMISADDGVSFSVLNGALAGEYVSDLVHGADGRVYATVVPVGPATYVDVVRTVSPVANEVLPVTPGTLRVWPSPAKDAVQVAGAAGVLTVYDALGRVVGAAPAGAERLDVSRLAPGVYVVRDGLRTARVVVSR